MFHLPAGDLQVRSAAYRSPSSATAPIEAMASASTVWNADQALDTARETISDTDARIVVPAPGRWTARLCNQSLVWYVFDTFNER
jgi:hypothetical protein